MMLARLIGLAGLAAGGYYLLARQGSRGAFGESGIPWAPNLGAFGESGIPFSPAERDRREGLTLDDGSLDLNMGWLTDGWLTNTDSGSDWLAEDWSIFDMSDPRGLRNHNPGNIEYTGTRWQGLADPPSDGRFARFLAPEYGIRAMSRILDTYRDRYGLNTVQSIVSRWAPAHENNTTAYASFVARRLGVDPTEPLTAGQRPDLIAAMIEIENGQQPYPNALIEQGVAMA